MYQTLVEAVLYHSKENPEKAAVCFRKEVLSYNQLTCRIKAAAGFMAENGVKKGDRVAVTAVSKPEYVVGFLAAQYLGAVAVPIDKNAKPATVETILKAVDPILMLSDTQTGDNVNVKTVSLKTVCQSEEGSSCADPAVLEDKDLLELLFTTGTTGNPKGAMLTKGCIYANMLNTFNGIGMKEDDVILLPLPLNHSFGIRVMRSTLYAGATLVLQNGFSFAKEIEDNIERYHCTGLAAVSASMDVILGQMQDRAHEILGKLRYIEISAGSLDKRLRRKIPQILPEVELHNTWGSTESGGALFLNLSKHPEKIDSIGKPLEGIDIKVLDSENNEITGRGPEHVGKMALRGAMQMAGYWNNPELTAETLSDGWLITSDLVYLDQEGYVYMLGRADDIINVGGEKVSPIEVENAANENPHIRGCACIGVPDPNGVSGQTPVLFVVANDSGYTEEGIKVFLSEKLERFKVPTEYVLIRELPRNNMKKLDRKALRKMWDERGNESLINPVIQAIFGRRSIRRFLDKPIERDILEMLVQAGYYAPSGHNMQSWHFTVVSDQSKISRLKELTIETAKKNDVMCYGFENPAALILVSNDERNPYGCQDASAAAQNIMLAAYSYGIGSVWLNPLMTLRDKEPISSLLDEYGVPKGHVVWSMVALGYPESEGAMLAKKAEVYNFAE